VKFAEKIWMLVQILSIYKLKFLILKTDLKRVTVIF